MMSKLEAFDLQGETLDSNECKIPCITPFYIYTFLTLRNSSMVMHGLHRRMRQEE